MKKRIACVLLTLALLFCLLPPVTAVAAKKHVSFPAACSFLYGADGTIDYTNDRDFAVHLGFLYPDVLKSEAGDELAVACGPENIWFLEPGESLRIELRFGGESEAPAPGNYRGEIRWAENDDETNASLGEGTIALTVVVPEEQETNPVSVTVLGDPAKVTCSLWASTDELDTDMNVPFAAQGAARIIGGVAPVGWYVGLEATSKGAQGVDGTTAYIEENGEPMGVSVYRDFSGQASVRFASGKTGKGAVTFTLVLDLVWLTLQPNGAPGYAKYSPLPGNWPGTVPENPFTYDGHAFLGWNTQADGSGTPYAPGDEITLTEGTTFYAQWAEDPPGGGQTPTNFTGVVTYRSGKEAYLQDGDRGLVALLDSSNAQADLDAVQVGKLVTVTGEAMTMNRSGYHIPEIVDAMIVEVKDTEATAASAAATIDQLNDGLMARLVRVKATKKALAEANLQLDLDKYLEEQVLTVTGVLSADIHGRVLLGATIQAEHVPGEPVKENEVAPTCTDAGSYDEVTYCAVCHEELSRVTKTVPALGHAPGEPVKENEVPATTTAEGSYDEVVYCTRCHAELSRVHKITEKLPVPPTIKTQPKDAKVKSGSKAKFAVKAKEKDVTYQWFVRASAKDEWKEMKGETKDKLNVVGTGTNNGWQYRCRLRNKAGGEVYSNIATLTVTLQKPVIKTQPKNLTVKSGKKVKFSVKASGKNITYQWFTRANAESEWQPVAGGNKKDLNVVASKANNGSQYYCYLKNADGDATSAIVTLTVTPEAPTIKTQPKDAKVKIGAKAKFKVKASGKNVTYQWYYRTSEAGEWVLMEGETSANLTVVATEGNIGWQFRCLAKNADGQVYSKPATLLKK